MMNTTHDIINASPIRFGTSGVRGLVTEMTDAVCFAYTLAFLHGIAIQPGTKVALGMDLRPSSPSIAAACAAAVHFAGLTVDFCGILPTPALAYYAQERNQPAIMVTGSHIPFDRNGIKFYRVDGEISKQDEAAINQAALSMPNQIDIISLPEVNLAAYQAYIDRYLQFFPAQSLAGLRLGFYEHSSAGREILPVIAKALGAELILIGRTDAFVPIDTEAVSEKDAKQGQQWAEEYDFDAILSTDGDADRPLLGDEQGHWLRGDVVGILCAQYLAAKAVATPVNSNTALDQCGQFTVLRTRIGSPYVIAGMAELLAQGHQPVVGFEANGGFLVASRLQRQAGYLLPLATRDALLPMLALLAMAKERGCKVSQLADSLPPRFTASDRVAEVAPETSQAILASLLSEDSAIVKLLMSDSGVVSAIDQTDGVRLSFENGDIVHFRASGNAPELRCYAESVSQERTEALVRKALMASAG